MGDTYLGGGSDNLGGGEGTTGCPEGFETWYRYRCQMGSPSDLSMEQIKSVDVGEASMTG